MSCVNGREKGQNFAIAHVFEKELANLFDFHAMVLSSVICFYVFPCFVSFLNYPSMAN